jgi:hypothetical protein
MPTGRFLALAAIVAGPLVLAAPAAAGAHHGTGQSTLTSSTTLSVAQVGGRTIIDQLNMRADVGAFTGTVTEHIRLVVNPTGTTTLNATAELNGTYEGCGPKPVMQEITLSGLVDSSGNINSTFRTLGGAAVTVVGTVSGTTASPTSDFEITYFC